MHADVAAEKFIALCRTMLPAGVKVYPGPPAAEQSIDRALWLDEDQSEYEWRGLGVHPGNRREEIVLTVVLAVYREGSDQQRAQKAARTVAADLERAIEEHVLGDTCDLDGVVADARVAKSKRSYVAADKGWTRRIVLTIVAHNHP